MSCSTAAARNVSPAASSTFLFALCSSLASLEIDVVLPEPLTPATRITVGPVADCLSGERGSFTFQVGPAGPFEDGFELVLDDGPDGFVDDGAAEILLPQLGHDFVGRLDAQVGLHEPRLESLELGLVENLARLEDIADVGLQKLSGFLQPLLEFVKQSHRRRSLG